MEWQMAINFLHTDSGYLCYYLILEKVAWCQYQISSEGHDPVGAGFQGCVTHV